MMAISEQLTTERLALLPPDLSFQPQVLAAIKASKDQLMAFLPWVPYALTQEESVENMEQAIDNFQRGENELRFFVFHRQTDEVLGAVGLIIRDKSVPFYEIGYWANTQFSGKGYISEAVTAVERYAFDVLHARRVEIKCAESNVKSKSVAERCGYEFEARLKHACKLPNGLLDNTLVFAKIL